MMLAGKPAMRKPCDRLIELDQCIEEVGSSWTSPQTSHALEIHKTLQAFWKARCCAMLKTLGRGYFACLGKADGWGLPVGVLLGSSPCLMAVEGRWSGALEPQSLQRHHGYNSQEHLLLLMSSGTYFCSTSHKLTLPHSLSRSLAQSLCRSLTFCLVSPQPGNAKSL